MSARRLVDGWKLDRIIELATRTGSSRVTVPQIAERLGLTTTYVIRYCRQQGVEPPYEQRFSYRDWLTDQYERDRQAGRVTGRRPPSFRSLS